MWMSEVAMKVWIRGRAAGRSASAAFSMSVWLARAKAAMMGPRTSRAMSCTAWRSPGDATGKPASMTSTPRRASCRAISSFSWALRFTPGDCSPSRSVVSKIRMRRILSTSSPIDHPRVPQVLDLRQALKHMRRDRVVHAEYHHGLAADLFAAHLHEGDVDAVLAQERPDLPDHAGTVHVPGDQEIAGRIHIDPVAVDAHQGRHVAPGEGARHRALAGLAVAALERDEALVVAGRGLPRLGNLDAPILGDHGGVHVVDRLVQDRVQHPLEHRPRQGRAVHLRQLAAVDDLEPPVPAAHELRVQAAQALREVQERPQLL